MSSFIYIHDPSDKPYGPLSNNYDQEFHVYKQELVQVRDQTKADKKITERKNEENIIASTWRSVSNYVYANLLLEPTSQFRVKSASPSKALEEFIRLYPDQYKGILYTAYVNFYSELVKQVKGARVALLKTGRGRIVYVSTDVFAGVIDRNSTVSVQSTIPTTDIITKSLNQYKKHVFNTPPRIIMNNDEYYGNNIVGESIMQVRNKLRQEGDMDKENIKYEKIRNMLYTRDILYKAIRQGDTLLNYTGKTYEEIILEIGAKKYQGSISSSLEKNVAQPHTVDEYISFMGIRSIPIDTIKIMLNSSRIPNMEELHDPCLLIMRLRQILRNNQIHRRDMTILRYYAEYILEKNYPEISPTQYTKAWDQQLAKLDGKQAREAASNMYSLYKNGMLSERLSKKIDEFIGKHTVIDTDNDAEIVSSKCNRVDLDLNEVDEDPSKIFLVTMDKRELLYDFYPTITRYNPFVKIEGRNYPNCVTYVATVMFKSLTSMYPDWSDAYRAVSGRGRSTTSVKDFKSFEQILTDYEQARQKDLEYKLRSYTRQALQAKFTDRNLQNLLLYTTNQKLVWDEQEDSYLGNGTKEHRGQNIAGKLLEELRGQILTLREKESTLSRLTNTDIDNLLAIPDNKDGNFIRDWVRMRLKDVCSTLSVVSKYLVRKGIDHTLVDTPELVELVFYSIYYPCKDIYEKSKKITVNQVPESFRELVGKQRGFCNTNESQEKILDLLWKYIIVVLYYFSNDLSERLPLVQLSSKITRAEYDVSRFRKCAHIYGNKYDDCKAAALINLLCTLVNIQKVMNVATPSIDQLDVLAATSIILETPLSTKGIENQEVKEVILTETKPSKKQPVILEIKSTRKNRDIEEGGEEEFIGYESEDEGENDNENENSDDENEDFIMELEATADKYEYNTEKANPITFTGISVLNHIPKEYREYILNPSTFDDYFNSAIQTLKSSRIDKDTLNNRINFFSSWSPMLS